MVLINLIKTLPTTTQNSSHKTIDQLKSIKLVANLSEQIILIPKAVQLVFPTTSNSKIKTEVPMLLTRAKDAILLD